jgi:DNA-directed RNA polymerase subunit RPC12/RpoP
MKELKIINNEIDSTCTDELVCPYCGHQESDSWEVYPDDGVYKCGECEKEYTYSRYVSVTYTTKKLK